MSASFPISYDGLAWSAPIEYVGQFPTMPLHRHHIPVAGLLMKRGLDILVSVLALIVLSPLILFIIIAIRLDSPGPNFLWGRTDWEKRPHLPLLEVPHHGSQCRFAAGAV